MGTTDASGLKEVMIGSFTAEIMTKLSCPILATPKNYQFKLLEKITYAIDFDSEDILAIKYIAQLNTSFNGQIHILHVCDHANISAAEEIKFAQYKEKVEKQCEGIPLLFYVDAEKR